MTCFFIAIVQLKFPQSFVCSDNSYRSTLVLLLLFWHDALSKELNNDK